MFNWVCRVVWLGLFCWFGIWFYVNRGSYTVDQLGWFVGLWFILSGVVVFLRSIYDDLSEWKIKGLEGEIKLWKDKWLVSREEFRRLGLKRCSRAGGWLVREWDGYFLRDDSDMRRDDVTGETEEAYSLFRLRPYGRVEVFVGGLDLALKRSEEAIAKDEGEVDIREIATGNAKKFVDAMESAAVEPAVVDYDELSKKLVEMFGGRVDDISVVNGMVNAKMSIEVVKPAEDIILNLVADDTQVGQLTKEAFVEGCKIMKETGGVPMVDDFIKLDGIKPGEVVDFVPFEKGGKVYQFESTVGPVVIDTRGLETLGKMMEVEKPTAYDPLIGDTGTTMVPVPEEQVVEKKVDDPNTIWGQLAKMNIEIDDKIRAEEDVKAWGALLKASEKVVEPRCGGIHPVISDKYVRRARAEDDGVFEQEFVDEVPIRMLFSELALGARFRYINESGDVYDSVWIKLSDFDSRGVKCGLVAEYNSEYIRHKDWIGQNICDAEETVAMCASLVVELVW